MSGWAEFFKVLMDSSLLTAAFIIGAIALIVTLIGKIPGVTPIELSGPRSLGLALFGLLMMGFAVVGFIATAGSATRSETIVPTTAAAPISKSTQETLPVIVPAITPTPTPVSLGTLTVPGNSDEGIRFTASQPGQYVFKYVGGSYTTYPVDRIPSGTPTWLTAVRIFKNRPAEWNGVAISNFPDINAVDFGYSFSASEAESKAQGQTATVSLLQGDYLILVAVDGRPYYSDNPGEVVFEVLFVPTQ